MQKTNCSTLLLKNYKIGSLNIVLKHQGKELDVVKLKKRI